MIVKRIFFQALTVTMLLASTTWAEKARLEFGKPQVKVFALKIRYGPEDPISDWEKKFGPNPPFVLLYKWFIAHPTGESYYEYSAFLPWLQKVLDNLGAHKILRQPLNQVIVMFNAHGSEWLMTDYSAKKPTTWETIAEGLVLIRRKMDMIDPKAKLVIISDPCYSGVLALKLQAMQRNGADGKMHDFAFLGGANDKELASTYFEESLLSILQSVDSRRLMNPKSQRPPVVRDPFHRPETVGWSWESIYMLLKQDYNGWYNQKNPFWSAAFYLDSELQEPLNEGRAPQPARLNAKKARYPRQ